MDQPSIHLFGYLFHEPVTAITNFILCACCLFFGFKVGKSHARYWSYFFYAVAVATFFAAFGHSLYIDKNNILQLISRSANITAVCLASIASILYLRNKNVKLFLYLITIIQFSIAIVYIIMLNRFWIVKWDAIIGLGLLVGGVNIFLASKGNKGSVIILKGIVITSLTAIIHSNKISISKWFNYNDISHVILFIGFYIIAQGAVKLQEYATN